MSVTIKSKPVQLTAPAPEKSASMGGMRFLILPVVGMPNALKKDGAFIFMMRIAEELIALGNYCYVSVPQDADTSLWKDYPGLMFIPSAIPSKVFDAARTTIDTATLGECFSYQYGRYVIDAAVVMTGQQALMVKMALASEVKIDVLPVFCVEQGVSWFGSDPGHVSGGFNDHLHAIGSSYSHMLWVSPRDRRLFLEKSEFNGLTPARIKDLDSNGAVSAVPINLGEMHKHKPKKPKNKTVALFAARANSTKHPEIILSIFDELYKQGEPIEVVFMTQTAELIGELYTNRHFMWDERQYVQKRYGCDASDFYQQAAKSHIFLCWSDSESYNVSAGEAALLGCVFICQNSPAHRELFSEVLTDDRFWAVDYMDAVEKVRWVMHNYKEAYALQQEFRDKYVKDSTDKHPAHLIATGTQKHIKAMALGAAYKPIGMGKVIDAILPAIKYPLKFHDFLALIEKESLAFLTSNLRRAISRKMPVDWALHGFMREVVGVKDTCLSRHPIYVKEEK